MDRSTDEINAEFFDRLNAIRDQKALSLALAQNVTTNGRLFCCLLAFANYAAGQHIGVAMAAVPVAFAWAADLSGLAGKDAMHRHCSRASVGTAIGLAIATLVSCW